jgi:hypothetical protein
MVAKPAISPILNSVKSKRFHFSSIFIILGALLFVLVGGIAAWGDVRSIAFDNRRLADEPLSSLKCPAVLTNHETGTISATIVNNTEEYVSVKVRAAFTDAESTRPLEIESEVPLEPNKSWELSWPVSEQNAEADHFILVRIHQIASASTPDLNASCGIFVINFPFLTGSQLVPAVMGLAALLSGAGLLIWGLKSTPRGWRNPGFRRWLFFIGVAILLTVIALEGYWGAALLIAIVWILQAIELSHYFFSLKRAS